MKNMTIRDFANQAAMLVPDTNKRRIVVPTILGMAIANFLQPKMGDDLNPIAVFNETHAANVARVVSAMTEEMIVDVPTMLEAAKAMYIVRHRILNCRPADYSANPEFDFMGIALGLSAVMTVEAYTAIHETGLSASKMYQLANFMVEDMKQNKLINL